MKHPHWLISTRPDGVRQRCRFDGHEWHVVMSTPEGREAASNDVLLMDAADKAALMLGIPRNHELPPDTPKTRGEPVPDPVAILHRAIRERDVALRETIREYWLPALAVAVALAIVIYGGAAFFEGVR